MAFRWRADDGPSCNACLVHLKLWDFYGIWTSIAKKIYFCDFQGGVGTPCPPPLDPPMIRLLPSANWAAIALGLLQDDRPMSVRFYGPWKGVVRRSCGPLTTIARVYDHFLDQDDNLKPCVVLTITVRCPYGDRTMSLPCVNGLWAYFFFSNL